MFARPGRSVFVCLRCQLRFAEKSERAQQLAQIDRTPLQQQRRWQSAAVAAAETVQNHEDNHEQLRPRLQSNNKFKGEKVWKPNRTATLGVPSLGRPAEVLLLSERDRHIPETLTDAGEGHEGNALTAAWNTENQSLSTEQLTKNIELIRDQARQGSDKDIESYRKKLRKRLQDGFSAKQLRNYIDQMQDESAKPWRIKPRNKTVRYSVKYQMVRYIFKHIWGIQGPDTAESTEFVEPEKSREVVMSSEAMELLLLKADSLYLKQICIDHKVQIDLFREPARVLVSGASGSVDAARQLLQDLQKKVKKHDISLETSALVEDMAGNSTLLAAMRQKFHVHPTRRKHGLRIFYYDGTPPDFAAIKRHILLSRKHVMQSTNYTIWPQDALERSDQVQVDLPGQLSSEDQGDRKRLVTFLDRTGTPSIPQMSSKQKSAFSAVYKSTREAVKISAGQQVRITQDPAVRIEITASFGQARMIDGGDGPYQAPKSTAKATMSFLCQIPLLPQFLGRRKPRRDDVKKKSLLTKPSEPAYQVEAGGGSSHVQPAPFTYELILASVTGNPAFPLLKVQLVGADAALGLKQPLQIRAVSAVLQTKTSYLLLPSQAADIKFENQVLCDVYREGKQSHNNYEKFLSQLATYLSNAGSMPQPQFAPFTILSIPVSLRTQLSSSTKREGGAPHTDHEYVLESGRALDVASYWPPFLSKLCLDHIVFHGDDRSDSRQLLQLTERPSFGAPSKQKTSFASFFNSAYEIALLLGDAALLPTGRS